MFQSAQMVSYRVRDLEKAKQWYRAALGCEPAFDSPLAVIFRAGTSTLVLVPTGDAARDDERSLAFWTVDDIEAAYERLLEVFWRNVDPFAKDRQFCDRGDQYRSAIFYRDDEQKRLAEASKHALEEKLGKPFVTEIERARRFYRAEGYHQDYYEKNPVRYKFYRYNCGRDQRLEEVWGTAAGSH